MNRTDPFLRDADGLRRLASETTIRDAHDDHARHRVLDVDLHEDDLTGLVEHEDGSHVRLRLTSTDDGELAGSCTCGVDGPPLCRHAVAVLVAHTHELQGVAAESAADEAIARRLQRARTQVGVRHVAGDPWFGTFEARSIGSAHGWRVQIRSLGEGTNHCSCPDFAVNGLGTCKHVASVLHHLEQRAPERFARLAERGPTCAILHLAWDVPEAPAVRLTLPRDPSATHQELAARWCDAEGLVDERDVKSLHALLHELRDRENVQVGDEVVEHVHRIAEEAAHEGRQALIRQQVAAGGGRLPGVRARLYPYQVEGVAFLASAGRAVLADDMGLGKTLQAIAAASWLMSTSGVRRALVVCPASLKHQWAREIERFTGRGATVVEGGVPQRLALYRRPTAFTIVNYELVRRDLSRIQEEVRPDLLVLDEAQRIKNWRTKTATAVKELDTRYAFVLSGTPLENRLEDLYSVMQVVDPRVLGPLWRFLIDFHVTDPSGRVLGYRNLSELRRRLEPVVLRRERDIVRDQLPDRVVTRRDVPLDKVQRELHDGATEAAAQISRKAANEHRPLTPGEENRLMAALQSARMACNAAGLVDKETEGSPKLDELAGLLEEVCVEGGRKVVVFSQWTGMTRMAEQVARRLGLGTVHLHGGVPSSARGDLVQRFFDDPSVQVFLSTDAGSTGLNLQCATVLVNLDMPWNPAVLDQRIGRIHRLGQREPTQVVLLVGADCYEARVASLVDDKRVLFDNVVREGGEADVVGLTRRSLEVALKALDVDAQEDGREESAPPGPEEGAPEPVESAGEEPSAEASSAEASSGEAPVAAEEDPGAVLEPLLREVQAAFAGRIERIMGLNGGLVVVLRRLEPEDSAQAAALSSEVPVAVMDPATAACLQRMGALGKAPILHAEAQVPRLAAVAGRKLKAAEALAAAGCGGEAMAAAVDALLASFAVDAEEELPLPERALAWVMGALVPRGIVDDATCAAFASAAAFAGADEVPASVLERVLAATSARVGTVAA